jgi:hypothetical protein
LPPNPADQAFVNAAGTINLSVVASVTVACAADISGSVLSR